MKYEVGIPEELWYELVQVAQDKGVSPGEVIRMFFKLGLVAWKVRKDPNAKLIIREGERERELTLD